MSRPTLKATLRTVKGKGAARKLRAKGQVPAVIYGKGKEPAKLTLDPKAFVALLEGPGGRYQPIDVQIEGEAQPRLALVKDFVVHPFKRTLKHIDLWQVEPDQSITVKVPLTRSGVAPLEKLGGRVTFTHKLIKIQCTPSTMPSKIEYDMSGITEESKIRPPRVSEIAMPDGVKAIYKNDFLVHADQAQGRRGRGRGRGRGDRRGRSRRGVGPLVTGSVTSHRHRSVAHALAHRRVG